jgi:hypothetical protein
MPEYAWRCTCGERTTTVSSIHDGPVAPSCSSCGGVTVRDYRAANLQLAIGDLKRTNRVGHSASLFLPDAQYFESPTDPDGTKGIKEWNETHIPKGHSGRTRPGVRESKTYY